MPTFIVEEIVFVIPSITETVPDSILVTYAKLSEGFTAIPTGLLPTDTSVILRLVEPSITDTESDPLFVTYTLLFRGLTSILYGKLPTWTVASILSVLPSTIDTVFENSFATYILLVVGLTATHRIAIYFYTRIDDIVIIIIAQVATSIISINCK